MIFINYWSDKLSSILDFTFDPPKRYFNNSAQKSGVICLSRPHIPARLSSEVLAFHVPTSLSPHVPTSQCPHVPSSPRLSVPKSHVPRPRPTFSNSRFNGAETNCRIAHILGILLMNSCNTDIFFSNYYNLQSVHFEMHSSLLIFLFKISRSLLLMTKEVDIP